MAVQPSSLPNFSQDVQTYLQLEDQIQELKVNSNRYVKPTNNATDYAHYARKPLENRTFALGGKSVSVERKQYSTLSFNYLAEKLPKSSQTKTKSITPFNI